MKDSYELKIGGILKELLQKETCYGDDGYISIFFEVKYKKTMSFLDKKMGYLQ